MKLIPEIIEWIRQDTNRDRNDRARLLALCDSHEALQKEVAELKAALRSTESDFMAVRRALIAERDRLKAEVEALRKDIAARIV